MSVAGPPYDSATGDWAKFVLNLNELGGTGVIDCVQNVTMYAHSTLWLSSCMLSNQQRCIPAPHSFSSEATGMQLDSPSIPPMFVMLVSVMFDKVSVSMNASCVCAPVVF